MNFEKELKKRNMNIRTCSIRSGIPYSTLYPIIKGQVEVGTCSYYTVEKLANTLGYKPEEIVYRNVDFQTFRNNLHHQIVRNELETILSIIEDNRVEYYCFHEDYLKALYLVATVDYISKKYEIPLCSKYSEMRRMKLEVPYHVKDYYVKTSNCDSVIEEFVRFNIIEGDLYDAI